jgi:hypothetical protein
VRLGGEVHHHVGLADQLVDQVGVRDVTDDQRHPVTGQPVEGPGVAGIGQLVEYDDLVLGVLDKMPDEVGPDEPGAAGDEEGGHGRPC